MDLLTNVLNQFSTMQYPVFLPNSVYSISNTIRKYFLLIFLNYVMLLRLALLPYESISGFLINDFEQRMLCVSINRLNWGAENDGLWLFNNIACNTIKMSAWFLFYLALFINLKTHWSTLSSLMLLQKWFISIMPENLSYHCLCSERANLCGWILYNLLRCFFTIANNRNYSFWPLLRRQKKKICHMLLHLDHLFTSHW